MSASRIIQLLLCFSVGMSVVASAQAATVGEATSKYSIRIDLDKAYVSGLCIIKGDESILTTSVVNEFGVSVMTLRYDLNKDKVKIVNCIRQLRRPFIKKVLKKDFKVILTEYLNQTESRRLPIEYVNLKQNITYNLKPF